MREHYVYRTQNKINGRFYYGVHNNSKPYYLGSGTYLKKAIKKYGRDNFRMHIVKGGLSKDEAYALEELIVTQDFVDRSDCYNAKLGGWNKSGHLGKVVSSEHKAKISKALKEVEQPYHTCPNCGHKGKSNAMFRWHFNNCKNK